MLNDIRRRANASAILNLHCLCGDSTQIYLSHDTPSALLLCICNDIRRWEDQHGDDIEGHGPCTAAVAYKARHNRIAELVRSVVR